MSLIGYPEEIRVTLGSAWDGKNGLSYNTSIVLHKVSGLDVWTEDGSTDYDDTDNRLGFYPYYYEEGGYRAVEEMIRVSNGVSFVDGQIEDEEGSVEDEEFSGVYNNGLSFQQLWKNESVNTPWADWEDLELAGFLSDQPEDDEYRYKIFSNMESVKNLQVTVLDEADQAIEDAVVTVTQVFYGHQLASDYTNSNGIATFWITTGFEVFVEASKTGYGSDSDTITMNVHREITLYPTLPTFSNITHNHTIGTIEELKNVGQLTDITHGHQIGAITGEHYITTPLSNITHGHQIEPVSGVHNVTGELSNVNHAHTIQPVQPVDYFGLLSDLTHDHQIDPITGTHHITGYPESITHGHTIGIISGTHEVTGALTDMVHGHTIGTIEWTLITLPISCYIPPENTNERVLEWDSSKRVTLFADAELVTDTTTGVHRLRADRKIWQYLIAAFYKDISVIPSPNNKIHLEWTDVFDEGLYIIERKLGAGTYAEVARLGSNMFIDGPLEDAGTYTYRITAKDLQEDTNESNEESIAVTLPARFPRELSYTFEEGTLTLTWDAVANADSYNVYCSDGSDRLDLSSTPDNVVTEEYTKEFTTETGVYVFWVTGVNAVGESASLQPMLSLPFENGVLSGFPANPILMSVEPTAGGTVTVTANYNTGLERGPAAPGVGKYLRFYGSAPGGDVDWTTPVHTIEIDGSGIYDYTTGALVDGETYKFGVMAETLGGTQNATKEWRSAVPDSDVPDAPVLSVDYWP